MKNWGLKTSLCYIALTAATSSAWAQANSLASGLQNRIVKIDGTTPERDASGNINAGYFRLVAEDSGSANAAICPKVKYQQVDKKERKRWRTAETLIYSRIFDKNVSWTLTGDLVVASPVKDEPLKTKLRFASIQNAEESNCSPQIGDPTNGISYSSFLVPINRNLRHFGETALLTLSINYSNKADKKRITNLWDGITLGVSTVIPAAAPVMEALSSPGQSEIDNLLDRSNTPSWTQRLETQPTTGGAGAYYLDLGFFHDDLTIGTSGNSGVNIKVEYIGTVFSNGSFLKDLQITPENITTNIINTQVRLPDGNKAIPDILGATQYNQLRNSNGIASFNDNCTNAITTLTNQGLSEIDATIFVKAVGSLNTNIKDDLKSVSCLISRNQWLKLVGMGIDTTILELQRPDSKMLYGNFDLIGAALNAGEVKPIYTSALAENVKIFADGPARTLLGMEQSTIELPKVEALNLIATKFSKIGCYSPRESNPGLELPVRPGLVKIEKSDFSGAAALQVRDPLSGSPRVMIGSFISGGFVVGGSSKISFISITDATSTKDKIYADLTENRDCGYEWMNEMTSS